MKFARNIFEYVLFFLTKKEKGAVGYLTICAAVPLTLMLFYMVNSSKAINDKTRTQDAADMAVLAHASEAARSMNTLSMNQVSMTQAWTVTATSGTLHDILIGQIAVLALETAAIAKNAAEFCKGHPIWVGICLGRLAIAEGIVIAHGVRVYNIFDDYEPGNAYDLGKKSMLALNDMNEAIVDRFPEAAAATAQTVAKSANVEDIYFDQRCKTNCGPNTNITVRDTRLGMVLPVDKNPGLIADLYFCAAMHLGTGGFNVPVPIPGISGIGATFNNGSYIKRKFPSFTGPMRAGKTGRKDMTKHVNHETGIGELLKDNYDFSREKWLWFATSTWDYLKGGWPTKQKKDNNYFTQWMLLKVITVCSSNADSGFSLGTISSFLGSIISEVPPFDKYHPKGLGMGNAPAIAPSLERFGPEYKPLGFAYRRGNKRWSPKVFRDPNAGFFTYSQAVVYNPDEISLYSQNWQSKLIPAKKMETDLANVITRMGNDASSNFSDLRSDLQRVNGDSSWRQVVAK